MKARGRRDVNSIATLLVVLFAWHVHGPEAWIAAAVIVAALWLEK